MNERIIKIFEYALNQEETGLNFFRNALQRLGIGAAITAFQRLIEEEEKHVQFISRVLKDLKTTGEVGSLKPGSEQQITPTDFFDQRARSEFLEQCIHGSMIPDVTVFNTAWLIEKDLSEFYAKMAGLTEGNAKEALTMLAHWEREHEKFFREYRDKLTEIYANQPWGG
jgi:rubrerythrin